MYTQNKPNSFHGLICGLVLLLWVPGWITSANSAELGHYTPAVYKARDYFVPPAGSYVSLIQLYYTADTLRDKDGVRITSFEVEGITINVDVDVDSYTTLPTFIYAPDAKLWGARYGLMVTPTFGNISFQAALESATNPEFALKIDDSSFGLGDAYVRPVWLGWDFDQAEVSASYGVHVPIGKFKVGAADNVGLGMWTHEFQLAGAYYLDKQRGTALTMAGTYEIHHEKKDVDIRPGSHFTLNLGASKYLPVSDKVLGELGVIGFLQRQVTRDKGSDAFNKEVKDQVYGLGLQGSLIYMPWGANLSFHWMHEFKAKDRFEGDFFLLSGTIPF